MLVKDVFTKFETVGEYVDNLVRGGARSWDLHGTEYEVTGTLSVAESVQSRRVDSGYDFDLPHGTYKIIDLHVDGLEDFGGLIRSDLDVADLSSYLSDDVNHGFAVDGACLCFKHSKNLDDPDSDDLVRIATASDGYADVIPLVKDGERVGFIMDEFGIVNATPYVGDVVEKFTKPEIFAYTDGNGLVIEDDEDETQKFQIKSSDMMTFANALYDKFAEEDANIIYDEDRVLSIDDLKQVCVENGIDYDENPIDASYVSGILNRFVLPEVSMRKNGDEWLFEDESAQTTLRVKVSDMYSFMDSIQDEFAHENIEDIHSGLCKIMSVDDLKHVCTELFLRSFLNLCLLFTIQFSSTLYLTKKMTIG